jgi:hypothetical protein
MTANAATPTLLPIEFVRSLPEGFKAAVLEALFRDFLDTAPDAHTIPLHTTDGQWLGNFVRPGEPAAAADRVFAELIPEERVLLMKPYLDLDLDDVMSDD